MRYADPVSLRTVKASTDEASSTPRPMAETAATTIARNAMPRMPPVLPRRPERRALVSVMTAPGPGLRGCRRNQHFARYALIEACVGEVWDGQEGAD